MNNEQNKDLLNINDKVKTIDNQIETQYNNELNNEDRVKEKIELENKSNNIVEENSLLSLTKKQLKFGCLWLSMIVVGGLTLSHFVKPSLANVKHNKSSITTTTFWCKNTTNYLDDCFVPTAKELYRDGKSTVKPEYEMIISGSNTRYTQFIDFFNVSPQNKEIIKQFIYIRESNSKTSNNEVNKIYEYIRSGKSFTIKEAFDITYLVNELLNPTIATEQQTQNINQGDNNISIDASAPSVNNTTKTGYINLQNPNVVAPVSPVTSVSTVLPNNENVIRDLQTKIDEQERIINEQNRMIREIMEMEQIVNMEKNNNAGNSVQQGSGESDGLSISKNKRLINKNKTIDEQQSDNNK